MKVASCSTNRLFVNFRQDTSVDQGIAMDGWCVLPLSHHPIEGMITVWLVVKIVSKIGGTILTCARIAQAGGPVLYPKQVGRSLELPQGKGTLMPLPQSRP